jgi:hypothetical protein
MAQGIGIGQQSFWLLQALEKSIRNKKLQAA